MNTIHELPEIIQASAARLASEWEQSGPPITMYWQRGEKMAWKRITRMTVGELEQAAEYHLRSARFSIREYKQSSCPIWGRLGGAAVHFARFLAARSLQLQGVTPEEWMLPFSNMEDDA